MKNLDSLFDDDNLERTSQQKDSQKKEEEPLTLSDKKDEPSTEDDFIQQADLIEESRGKESNKSHKREETFTSSSVSSTIPENHEVVGTRRRAGKRSDPNYVQVTLLVTKESHFKIKTYCVINSLEISNTIEKWVNKLCTTNIPKTVPTFPKRKGKRKDPNYTQLSFFLSIEAHRRLKSYCTLRGLELSDLVEEWIRKNLD